MMTEESKSRFTIYVITDGSIQEDDREKLMNAAKSAELLFGCNIFPCDEKKEDLIEGIPLNDKGQIGASAIMDRMQEEFSAKGLKGAMILFTSKDLYLGDTWCFGAARVGGGVSVQSLYRYKDLSESDRQAVITRTFRHELGHIHRCAASLRRAKTKRKFGVHCTSRGCTMRQSGTLKELLKHAKEEDPKDCLCDLCKDDLRRFKAAFY